MNSKSLIHRSSPRRPRSKERWPYLPLFHGRAHFLNKNSVLLMTGNTVAVACRWMIGSLPCATSARHADSVSAAAKSGLQATSVPRSSSFMPSRRCGTFVKKTFKRMSPSLLPRMILHTKPSCCCRLQQFLVMLTLTQCSFGVLWLVKRYSSWWTRAAAILFLAQP